MRRSPIVLAAVLLLGGLSLPAGAQTSVPVTRCRAETVSLSATGVVHSRAIPYFVEVELTVQNKTPGPIRVDPSRFMLVPADGQPVVPAPRDQVVSALRSPSSTYADFHGIFWSGSFGFAVGVGPIDLQARAIEGRIFRTVELAPGVSHRGSVYFRPAAWPAQFAVVLDGLTTAAGAGLAVVELQNCVMPVRPLAPPASLDRAPMAVRAIAVTAQATAGPVGLSVSRVEMARFATTLTVTVENAAEQEVSLFVAIGQAHLADSAGRTYAVRMLRSDLPDRVAPRGQARGQLVFEPLPAEPAVGPISLVMPGVRVSDAVYDLKLELRI